MTKYGYVSVQARYLLLTLFQVLFFLTTYVFSESVMVYVYTILVPIIGIWSIVFDYRQFRTLVTPISIYSFVWLICMPITSLEAPAMEPLSLIGIRIILSGGIFFCASGLFISLLCKRFIATDVDSEIFALPSISNFVLNMLRLITIISCASLVVNFLITGSIKIFSSGVDPADRKTIDSFFGFSFLSSLGTIGSFGLVHYRPLKRIDISLIVLYITLQLLTGQRWFIIVTILLILSSYSFVRFGKKEWISVFLGSLLIASFFIVLTYFRSSSSDFETYYIKTGIYSGSTKDLSNTEIIRYFGMCQRNMVTVFSQQYDISKLLQFSLTPILFPIIKPNELSLDTSINAYTANNILSYLYSDMGNLWWLLVVILSIIVNFIFYYTRFYSNHFMARILWSTCVLGLSLSFFAYVNAYFYWIILFPAMIGVILMIDHSSQKSTLNPTRSKIPKQI